MKVDAQKEKHIRSSPMEHFYPLRSANFAKYCNSIRNDSGLHPGN